MLAMRTALALLLAALLTPAAATAQSKKAPLAGLHRDALVLTQGHGKGGNIDAALARRVQKALARIRAAHPAVARLHARGHDLRSVFVVLAKGTRISAKLLKKNRTGQRKLDRLNARFKVKSIAHLVPPTPGRASREPPVLVVRFQQPMDVPYLVKHYKRVPPVTSASVNSFVGDGHDIAMEMAPRQWRFRFKKGSGDCPSGCIRNEYFYFTYDPRTGVVKQVKKK